MNLLPFREKINTECRIPIPILKIKAIKIDASERNLKQKVGCKNLKSCDYLKRRRNNLYFIEISDFNAQFEALSNKTTSSDSIKYINLEIRLKLTDTLLIYQKLLEKFEFKEKNCSLHKKALLTICKDNISDSVFLDRIARNLTRHYCPEHLSAIQLIPYTKLETILRR